MMRWVLFGSIISLFVFSPIIGFGQPSADPQLPSETINQVLNFVFITAGLLAFGAIVYGAVKYTFGSAGNSAMQSDAKDQITQAIIGLLLLIGSALILRTISPALEKVYIKAPTPVNPVLASKCGEGCTTGQCMSDGSCQVCSLICGGDTACAFENSQPTCRSCPQEVLAGCAPGESCKFLNGIPYCAVKHCGDNNKSGPCTNPNEICVAFPGLSSKDKLWGCVPKNGGAPT